jgi:excinuclease ABC subunit A
LCSAPFGGTTIVRPMTFSDFVRVRGAREHNLKNLDVDIPRQALVVFTGVSGSGKSSLAFGTLYAEAQRRYLESVSPYARRLFEQMATPDVDDIEGLPPAVALQQQRGTASTRSSVGSVTTLSNLLRMLYSRAGEYPRKQPLLHAEAFSPHTPEGACPECQGHGVVYSVTERSMVPDDSLTLRERAVAAWPTAWQGQNLRDILTTLGHDVDIPWRDLPKKDRQWILFTDEQPVVPVYAGFDRAEVRRARKRKDEPSYMGTFASAQRHVLHTFATSQSALMKRRALGYMLRKPCPSCDGKRLRQEPLSIRFAGHDIVELSRLPLKELARTLGPYADGTARPLAALAVSHPEKVEVTRRIASDMLARLAVLLDLGLGYLALERSTPTLSPGELQRLRLATQVRSNLFGVVYVLDEPTAGLHPADTEALLRALAGLKTAGNSLFVVEHEIEVMRAADWIVDVGPAAGDLGGEILYSGVPAGLRAAPRSLTARYLFADAGASARMPRPAPPPDGWLTVSGITRNNLVDFAASFPLARLTSVTGVSGSGKSTLVSQVLVALLADALGTAAASRIDDEPGDGDLDRGGTDADTESAGSTVRIGTIAAGLSGVKRLVQVDQKPIGRTPRSNLATYTGLFDPVRKLFAATKLARARHYDAGRFSFNVVKGRCEHCEGEGSVMVELLFLPSVYAPCPTCKGARYNARTLEVTLTRDGADKTIADVLALTVDAAWSFFARDPSVRHPLGVLREVGLGYLRLGQPATELSGGEAQRIKLATELQRQHRAGTLYVLDEPTTGLHPADVERLMTQLQALVDTGATVIVVEHDLHVIAESDWVIDLGPGGGDEGGRLLAAGTPEEMTREGASRTATYLRRYLGQTATSATAATDTKIVTPGARPMP